MEKWEYCVIGASSQGSKLQRAIYFLDANIEGGVRKEVFLENYDVMKARTFDFDAPVIARLGNDGWELVSVDTERHWYYFKRCIVA